MPRPSVGSLWCSTAGSSPTPYVAASRGFIDDVIEPRDTCLKIIGALEMLQNKTDSNPPKKRGNIPLWMPAASAALGGPRTGPQLLGEDKPQGVGRG